MLGRNSNFPWIKIMLRHNRNMKLPRLILIHEITITSQHKI